MQTRFSVKLADRISSLLITVGGIGTIVAVLGVALFLVWVAAPLFLPAKTSPAGELETPWGELQPLHLGVDEYQVLAWALQPDGRLLSFRLDNGEIRTDERLGFESPITAQSIPPTGGQSILGFANGSIQLLTVGFATEYLALESLPEEVRRQLLSAEPGLVVDFGDGVVQLTPENQVRQQRLNLELGPTIELDSGPVRQVHQVERLGDLMIAAVVDVAEDDGALSAEASVKPDDGQATDADPEGLRLLAVDGRQQENFLTAERTLSLEAPVEIGRWPSSRDEPVALLISGDGRSVLMADDDGWCRRIEREGSEAFVAEEGYLSPPGTALASAGYLLGNQTLLWGDAAGGLFGGFRIRLGELEEGSVGLYEAVRDREKTRSMLVRTHAFRASGSPIVALAPSSRSRLLVAGSQDGDVELYHATSAHRLAALRVSTGGPIRQLVVAPKEDGLLALTPTHLHHWQLDPRFPEASLAALFRPVWYEGYPGRQHIWQSSAANDDFEPKLGLMPLIFGTIKATLYSMLLGAPLALLAAIFTSELLHPRARGFVKPTIELMASLPSVVLGFLAALVFAPFVENFLAVTLGAFFTLPLAFALCAYLWQLLPQRWTLAIGRWRFSAMLFVVPLGCAGALLLGPVVERMLFAGDLRGWLAWDESQGETAFASSIGGWMLLCMPLSVLLVTVALGRLFKPRLREWSQEWGRQSLALADGGRFLLGLFLSLVVAVVFSLVLDQIGFDPRGGLLGTYVQRNALIVGFVMGFAVIPIIYTIAEDALSTVPEHLRAASLGAGATAWQTAVRIIIPTAMSGLFSALMVGLGRAVGETMIVLMAAGNTPVMEWNLFEGFRTLSANIAVELPEAVRGSTHYRTLFLAALVLFVMTFAVNTVAEMVRQRFRRRAYQL